MCGKAVGSPAPTRGGVERSWYKLPGPGGPQGGPELVYVTDVFFFLGVTNIIR